MNGIDAPSDDELGENEKLENRLTDYCIGRDVIYAAFSWSLAKEACEKMKQLAKQHCVGFFDVSSDDGDMVLIII